jgi:hypothetical protein
LEVQHHTSAGGMEEAGAEHGPGTRGSSRSILAPMEEDD